MENSEFCCPACSRNQRRRGGKRGGQPAAEVATAVDSGNEGQQRPKRQPRAEQLRAEEPGDLLMVSLLPNSRDRVWIGLGFRVEVVNLNSNRGRNS